MGECLCNITLFWTNIKQSPIKKDTSETCSDVPFFVSYSVSSFFSDFSILFTTILLNS